MNLDELYISSYSPMRRKQLLEARKQRSKDSPIDNGSYLNNFELEELDEEDEIGASDPFYQPELNLFLKRHSITSDHRCKLVDWMVQVFRVLIKKDIKYRDDCFFRTIEVLDRFFEQTEHKLSKSQLYIMGITSAMLTSKIEN